LKSEPYKSDYDYICELCRSWGEEPPPLISEEKKLITLANYDREYSDKKYNILKDYKMGVCGVYCITNSKNNKIYIGSSINIELRHEIHILDLNYKKHHNLLLQRDWIKFNPEDFVLEVLWEGNENSDRNEILFMEQLFINKHLPEYNIKMKVDYVDYENNK